jgi:hypothetical protein
VITSRPGRHGALLALAPCLAAPILAERLGIQQPRAAQWVRTAGATYSGYVELRFARDVGVSGSSCDQLRHAHGPLNSSTTASRSKPTPSSA